MDSSLQVHCWFSNLEQKRSFCGILEDNASLKILLQEVINQNSNSDQLLFVILVTVLYVLHSIFIIIVFKVVYEIVGLIKSKVGLLKRKEETLT